jgi:(1->4)-alpha-D-glucan 1-alpha-D-glucosylmutase
MSERDRLVERIAALVGIAAGYADAFGREVMSPFETKQAILAGFGLPTGNKDEARESLAAVEQLHEALLPPLIPVEANRPARIPLGGADGADTVVWRLADESGRAREARAALDDGALGLPRLAPGYYRLAAEAGGRSAEATLIAAPPRCFEPRDLAEGARGWGFAAQLYGLRSAGNLGIGT